MKLPKCFQSVLFTLMLLPVGAAFAQAQTKVLLLQPERVFDGQSMHVQWCVAVSNKTIFYAGPSANFKMAAGTQVDTMLLPGATLLPGLIEGHSHLFLHAYNETSWLDQVLNESRAERVARAVNHAYATLKAGFTTVRDLGTEGAAYDDVGLKAAIEKGIIPGPRMLVATKAIAATGSYAPKAGSADVNFPMGAAEADGVEGLTKEIRSQIGKGADLIKLYGDYRWGPNNEVQPTFTLQELEAAVAVTASSGRLVVVHASGTAAMKRAATAEVSSIEHGDMGNDEIFQLMKKNGVALCATLAATEAIAINKGWKKGTEPEPAAVLAKRKSFAAALRSGVTIIMGGDVGVYSHGTNAREMELMVAYGMTPLQVLQSATSVNATVFNIADKVGAIKAGLWADLMVVQGDPSKNIADIYAIQRVMKGGSWVQ